ncbi:MAG: winged helix-turn-helix transcriptional regulator [Candidatus Omnitrophica bacterium]|nr:winged helix-turn-helix transcriptional regulator [Candidatus Omnitrophota bacterium]
MNIDRFSKRMVELMPALIRGFARHEHNSLSRGEITLPQLWALEHLARQSPNCPMHALAELLHISRPAATGLINRLISQQLVRREADARDRRIVLVAITAKGRRALTNIWDQKQRMIVDIFGQISPSDRAHYLAILERVTAIASQAPRAKRRRQP